VQPQGAVLDTTGPTAPLHFLEPHRGPRLPDLVVRQPQWHGLAPATTQLWRIHFAPETPTLLVKYTESRETNFKFFNVFDTYFCGSFRTLSDWSVGSTRNINANSNYDTETSRLAEWK